MGSGLAGIIGGSLIAIIGVVGAWLTSRRITRGDPNTSTASELWEALRGELKDSRLEVAALKAEAIAARLESVALRDEALKLREELIVMRTEAVALRAETSQLREEMVVLRSDSKMVHENLNKCLKDMSAFDRRSKQ